MEGNQQDCSICFERLEKCLATTCCGHVFHLQCIKKWFQSKNTCPLCNKFNSNRTITKLFINIIDSKKKNQKQSKNDKNTDKSRILIELEDKRNKIEFLDKKNKELLKIHDRFRESEKTTKKILEMEKRKSDKKNELVKVYEELVKKRAQELFEKETIIVRLNKKLESLKGNEIAYKMIENIKNNIKVDEIEDESQSLETRYENVKITLSWLRNAFDQSVQKTVKLRKITNKISPDSIKKMRDENDSLLYKISLLEKKLKDLKEKKENYLDSTFEIDEESNEKTEKNIICLSDEEQMNRNLRSSFVALDMTSGNEMDNSDENIIFCGENKRRKVKKSDRIVLSPISNKRKTKNCSLLGKPNLLKRYINWDNLKSSKKVNRQTHLKF